MDIQIKYCKLKSPNIAYPSITAPKLLTLFENDPNTLFFMVYTCVHLHSKIYDLLLLKFTIATENLRSKISHKNQRSKI